MSMLDKLDQDVEVTVRVQPRQRASLATPNVV
jgi:hypothetical protein